LCKKIVFRCDSNNKIGLGHLVRCLAVANHLKGKCSIIFATDIDESNSHIKNDYGIIYKKSDEDEEEFLKRINSEVNPDILVLDHQYLYNRYFMQELKKDSLIILLFDNICDGMMECDEIIFPNAHFNLDRLKGYISQDKICNVKTGLDYVILRDEIIDLKEKPLQNRHKFKIAVTTGGSDPEGVLITLSLLLKTLNIKEDVCLLYGESFKLKNKLDMLDLPENFHKLPYSLEYLTISDIVICTFGMTVYEMIYLGLPTICVSHSKHNAKCARILKQRYNALENLGYIKDLDTDLLLKSLNKIQVSKNIPLKTIIDGKGALRVANLILEYVKNS
jgi:spore coat polysaccharide biosynthesis predicted glycosyltransferase SpsG